MELPFGEWKLRPWTMQDAPAVAKHANNRNVSRWLRDAFPYPYTLHDAESFIGRVQGQSPAQNFAITTADEAIGGVGVHPQQDIHRRSAEIGYWLAEPFWSRGIMTQAVRLATDYAFSTFDVVRLFATVFEGNNASRRVLEKAGFALEARLRMNVTKDGRTFDSFLYAKLKKGR